jgi:succinoglycan biosynthesis transport protein ExoP
LAEENDELKQTTAKLWKAAKRRRWCILSTFCIASLIGILLSFILPEQFRSEATILVEQQQVPERYVIPTTTADLVQALQAMTQEILSRARLLQIISEFDLYPVERKQLAPEELVQLMRKNIEIEPLVRDPEKQGPNAFKISFVGNNAATTQEVVNRLSSLFIVENSSTREKQANSTTNFLQDQLSKAQADLQEQEKRVAAFKMQHLGELPQEQAGNLQVLAGLQMQLQNSMASLGRAHEQQVYLESLLAQYRSLSPRAGADPSQPGINRIATVEKQLSDLRTQRAALQAHYTPDHPDVVALDRQITQTEALLDLLKKNAQKAAAGAAPESAAVQVTEGDDAAVAQLKSQLKANQVEIVNVTADEKQLEKRIADYQHRLNLTPVREQELAELLRNYTLSQQNYADLESKRTQSALAARLERDQQGQQLRIVDPANFPSKPFSPDRRRISLMGALLGLLLGAGVATVFELKDSSFHSEKEVSQYFALPFALGVPLFLSPTEEKRRSYKRILEWVGGSFLVAGVLVGELFVLWRG